MLADRATLDQYVLLSMLLHVLLIISLGDTSGGARRGERIWGAMNVTLQNLMPDRGSGAESLRMERSLRNLPAAQSEKPPAASSLANKGDSPAEHATPAAKAAPPTQVTAPAEEKASATMPKLIAKEVTQPVTGFVVPPPSTAGEESPAVEARPPEAPAIPATRLEPIAPLKAEREFVAPAQMKLRDQPVVLPTLAPVAPMAPTPSEREYVPAAQPLPRLAPLAPPAASEVAPAPVVRELTTPVTPLPQLAPLVAPPATPLVPAKIDRELLAPNQPLPQLAPLAPPPATTLTPAKIDREFVPPAVEAMPREPPAAAATPREESRPAATAPKSERSAPAADVRAAPAGSPKGERAPGTAGVPAGDPLATRRDTAPSANLGSAPRMDLESIRQRAREITSEGTGPRTVLPFPTAPAPPVKSKVEQVFDKALKRPDCKDAYASMGLAAVVPLLWDSVSNKGCKW